MISVNRAEYSRSGGWLPPLLITLAVFGAYANTLSCPFIFDSVDNISDNPSIRQLWPLNDAFWAPADKGIAGRPIINFSLAVNYAISGSAPWSYHLCNIIIHALAGLTLFGIAFRLLLNHCPGLKIPPLTARNTAGFIAMAWSLHPLQTEAVTYVIQRCESLMGLCFFLTLYAAIRGWESTSRKCRRSWHAAAICACLAGVGCKEVIVAAPLLVLLCDYLLVHRDWKLLRIIRASSGLYIGLLACMVLLAILVGSGRTAGSTHGRNLDAAICYWRAQPEVILHYLYLSIWPASLCLDYWWTGGAAITQSASLAAVTAMGVLCLYALRQRHPLCYPLIWFFCILAPTSLYPLPDAMFEHRMYLPLAAVIAILTLSALRLMAGLQLTPKSRHVLCIAFATAITGIFGTLTLRRNYQYANRISIWGDTVRKRPQNPRALYNLGHALANSGEYAMAAAYLQQALEHGWDNADTHNHLGLCLYCLGQAHAALPHFMQAVRQRPDYDRAWHNLGMTLVDCDQPQQAMLALQKAEQLGMKGPDLYFNRGRALVRLGKLPRAISNFRQALVLSPGNTPVQQALDDAVRMTGNK